MENLVNSHGNVSCCTFKVTDFVFCSFITLNLTLIALHNIPRSLWAHNLLLKGTQTEMGNTSDGDSLCNQYLVRLLYQCYT